MSSTSEAIDERMESEFIVDTDFHLQVPMATVAEYVDDDRLRRKIERFGAPTKPSMGWKTDYAIGVEGGSATSQGQAIDTEEILQVLEEMHVDMTVVDPGVNFPSGARYSEVKNALASAYNDYILDQVVDADRNVYATMVVPDWDPKYGAAEIERVGSADGIVGGHNWFNATAPFGASKNDPLFDALVDTDLPLVLHPLNAATRYDLIGDGLETFTEALLASLGYSALANVMSLIVQGVFEKYPDLEVLLQEAGTLWLPYAAHRGDELYQVYGKDVELVPRMRELERRSLRKLPSEYLFENFYVTTQPIALPREPSRRAASLEICRAEEMFMFSSDWPHGTVDTPEWLFEGGAIDDDLRAHICHGNAEAFFDVER